MYENEACVPQMSAAAGSALGLNYVKRPQVTVAENIDAKIKMHQECIERLEELKVKLQGSLLDVTISDLRDAMNY